MRKTIASSACLAVFGLLLAARPAGAQALAGFAFGRGKAAARLSIDVQRTLRKLAANTGSYKPVDLAALLGAGSAATARLEAIEDGKRVLAAGKNAYEQLDLEQAQKSFKTALRKFEYGYGYLDKPTPLLECLMYLGATWVLVGEPDKAIEAFQRAGDLPGRKVLDPNLFPPNIQQIFSSASQQAESAPSGTVTLLSVPQNAEIYLDGAYKGGSTLTLSDLRAGVHLVKAVKDGYLPWGGRIRVKAGKKRNLRLKLRPAVRHREFSKVFARMVAETLHGKPGPAARQMLDFTKAGRLALVALSGTPAAMNLSGSLCSQAGAKIETASLAKVLDTTSPGYAAELKSYLQALLTARPGEEQPAGGAEQEGAAAAAELLAGGGQADGAEGNEGFGLDLSADEKKPAAEEQPEEHPAAEEGGQTVAAAAGGEQPGGAEKTIEQTKPRQAKPEQAGASPIWYKQWWFWTAVGAVVAGAAATGTYFLVSAGGSSGGGLVLDIH